jgi:5-methyltetrahydropteroyltriglutamate--homocysteine methyltransferase
MTIPTEPIGSIPRPLGLIEAVATRDGTDPALDPLYEEAIRDTIERFEATGSPVITDGEQRKYHNFWTYCVHGLPNTAPDGFKIPFAAGHVRRMLRLTGGPFRYKRHADSYLDVAMRYSQVPLKQAVISPSALSLMYPADEIPGYSREEFIQDLLHEHETEIRNCLRKGAHKVQIDFTEGRLAVKIDPSGHLLHSFIDLNNLALSRFSGEDRQRIGVHTCPGGDRDSTHSADVDYAELLPSLFELKVGAHQAGSADFHRRRRADRPPSRDARGDSRPNLRSGRVHSGRATGYNRRLRFLALFRRYFDQSRHCVRKDPGARARHRAGGG